ncbi:MAG: serine/threonine-protein kinase, partial [Myxococcota bacterium]
AVVTVLDTYGEDHGYFFFVMELVHDDLERAVASGRLDRDQLLEVIVQVCDVLGEAHGRGWVHRDIKPSNILLTVDDEPRLTDFDLVGAMDTTGGTRTGAMGTFLYAAPEVLDRPQDADARADVYGLGMTTLYALYGRQIPFAAFRNIGALIGDLACGDEIKQVIHRAVTWERADRHRNALIYRDALRAAMAVHSAVPRPVEPMGELQAEHSQEVRALGSEPLDAPNPRSAGAASALRGYLSAGSWSGLDEDNTVPSPGSIVSPKDGAAQLADLQGVWRADSGTVACAKVSKNELLIPYSYEDDGHLTGVLHHCRVTNNWLVSRFTWIDGSASGYGYFYLAADGRLVGGWTTIRLQHLPESIEALQALPKVSSVTWTRIGLVDQFPPWAHNYFAVLGA